MIKNLRFKFVLVFLVLVVSVFITSTCYAAPTAATSSVISDIPFTLEDVLNADVVNTYMNVTSKFIGKTVDDLDFLIYSGDFSTYKIFVFEDVADDNYFDIVSSNNYLGIYDSSGTKNSTNSIAYFVVTYTTSTAAFTTSATGGATSYFGTITVSSYTNFYLSDLTTLEFKAYSLAFVPTTASVEVTYEFQSDTSAKVTFDYSSYGTDYILKYSLTGVELNTDLTAPLELKNPVIYTPRGK